jgi:hypothetical protein
MKPLRHRIIFHDVEQDVISSPVDPVSAELCNNRWGCGRVVSDVSLK